MTMITLLTDFGMRDGYVGVMRGVIWGIAPDVRITDLSHEISAQNVLEAALTLGRSFHYFPAGTIHIAVVRPRRGHLAPPHRRRHWTLFLRRTRQRPVHPHARTR